MKQVVFLGAFILALSAQAGKRNIKDLIHILPDSPGWVYLEQSQKSPLRVLELADPEIAPSIQMGERSLAWLTYMNDFRPADKKLQLTKPGDLKGIPIETPNKYSGTTVKARYQELLEQMPAEMKAVLLSTDQFPQNPPISDEEYVKWAKEVDRNYQTATRWKMMQPYLSWLQLEAQNDIRGFYFLSKKTENVEGVLRSLDTLAPEKQSEIKEWLRQMCQNAEGVGAGCLGKAERAIQDKQAYEFYLKNLTAGERIWNSYFGLENPRREFVWSQANPTEMHIPFQDPHDNTILDFLKINIEDEFKWNDWHMLIDFKPYADVHVEFEPGVTPHVNGAGGDTITMDKNTPLTEWDVQWTIRHEFGHVLGFVDCYVEFYDTEEKVMVNYQLDITHLMCSRAGRMQQSIFDTLKANYLK